MLELRYNRNESMYDLGTGYRHIVVVDDPEGTLDRLAAQGIESEPWPYTVLEGGSRLCFVKDLTTSF